MSTLVIVESPTKAKTITKFLGKGFTVESSFGHMRDLPKSKMGIDIEGGTFEPKYVIPRDKSKHVKKLKDLAKKADNIIFATDEDREGEAIAWHLAHILDIDPADATRIVFHEITKHAIDEALKKPRGLDQHLVDAQQARRVLDRLVGYELSPLLWKKVARGLSAGRVQSVALRLIVEREREIQAFVPEEYWSLVGLFQDNDKSFDQPVSTKLHSKDGTVIKKMDIKTKEQMDTILAELENGSYTISSIEQKETKRTPPPPFRTSTLQQQANQKLGYSSRQTMRLAQQLYEGIDIGSQGAVGLITYMRTDATSLSDKFTAAAHEFITESFGNDYALDKARHYANKSKGAQEAHEAIRPTDVENTPDMLKQYLDPKQHKLYTLIWNRAVATQMAQARLNKTTIDIASAPYTFRATGQTMVFDGWLRLYPKAVKESMLPELKEGQGMVCTKLEPNQHFTEPPPRYSDATLVKILEEHGIGRPSTYAPTIATIEARNYVERNDNKRFVPTDIAMVVTDLLVEHFTNIVDYSFTATMEDNLDGIATGTKDWQPIIATFYSPFHKTIEEKTESLTKEDTVGMRELGTDPESGKPIYARIGRYGPFVQKGSKDDEEKPAFASLAKGQRVDTITLEEALVLLTLPRTLGQDADGNDIVVNIGRFGPYVKRKSKYFSIKEDDPYTVTLERAKEIIQEKLDAEAKAIIKTFDGTEVIVKEGRYGPYITDGKNNAKIPKDTEPASLDLATCEQLLEEAAKKPKRKYKPRKKKA